MGDGSRKIGEAIERQRAVLAKAIVDRQWKARPDLQQRYGAIGYAKCLEDANYHLQYLCEAIDAAEPQLFSDYISWAKIMLASRKVVSEDLASHLQTLRDVVADNLPVEMGAVARDYVNAALRHCRSTHWNCRCSWTTASHLRKRPKHISTFCFATNGTWQSK